MFRNVIAFVALLTAGGCLVEPAPTTVAPTATVTPETTVDTVSQTTPLVDDVSTVETVEPVLTVEAVEPANESPSK
jgi:hypothetical protein